MENKFNRFLSLLLAFVMVLGMFPVGHVHVHAEESNNVSYVVDETPTAPEAGKTYVICFQKADGSYHAVTSTYAANWVDSSTGSHYIGTLDVNEFNGTYTTDLGWKLVQKGDKFYLNAADDGASMTLQGENTYDAFADVTKSGELMTLTATEDGGYTIMNPHGRYLAALSSRNAGTAALEDLIAAGNYTEPMTLYFFHVTENKAVNLNVGDNVSFDVPFDYSDLNTEELGDGFVTVEADTTFEYEVNNKPVTALRSGKQYVIYNWRAKNNLTAQGKAPIVSNVEKFKSNGDKPGLAMVHENSSDVTYEQTMWTFTHVSGSTYNIQDCNGAYLTLQNGVDDKAWLDAETACNLTVEYIANASAPDGGYWRIGTGNAWLNPHGGLEPERAASYNAGDAKTDEGSRWVIYEAHVVEDGERYAIVNNRAGQTLNSNPKNASDRNGQITGLTIYGTIEALTPNALWTIDAIEGSDGYSFMNGGKYMTFADRGASTVAEPVDLKIERNGSNLVIKGTDGGYLNDFGAQGICAAGWRSDDSDTAKTDAGSQWKFHRITSEEATTHFTVIAVAAGTTTLTFGDVTYTITVNEVHVHDWAPATCIAPETCTSCKETQGEVDPTNHVNTRTIPGTPPTMESTGTTDSVYCDDCQKTISGGETIAKLLAAAQLNGDTVVSLVNCEYTFTADSKLVHDGIYINVVNSGTKPGNSNSGNSITVSAGNNGAVQLLFEGGEKDYYLHFFSEGTGNKNPGWDRCTDEHLDIHSNGTHDLYLFKADENASADSLIPGYTKVTSLEENGKYLIVAKHTNGNYYVMAPSTSSNAADHIALLLTTHEHAYTAQVTAPTCTEKGYTTYTCGCGDTYKDNEVAALGHDWTDATCTAPKTCKTCGETEGDALGHDWADADCDTPKTCKTCGETEGDALGHDWADATCTAPKTCNTCGATEGDALGHDWADATCTAPKTCKTCGETEGDALGHTYDNDRDADCNRCGETREVPKFKIYKSSMSMYSSLNMNFCFEKSMVADWTGHYVVVTKDGNEGVETQTFYYDQGQWTDTTKVDRSGTEYFYVTFTGIAAKEMTDVLTVTVFDANDNPVSEAFTDTVRDHAIRNLQTTENDLNKTMIMDMLNYGAEAQKKAGYNTDKLANAGKELDAFRAYATKTISYESTKVFEGEGKYLANVKMVDSIKFMMAFSAIDQTMTATVTFKHWNGTENVSYQIAGKDFVKNGSYYMITLDQIVTADAFENITVVITDAEGNTVATVTDSIASYAARAAATNADLADAIMKFAASAKNYLQNK